MFQAGKLGANPVMRDNPPLHWTAAAVYFTCGRASRVRRRGRSTALRYAAPRPTKPIPRTAVLAGLRRRIRAHRRRFHDGGRWCVATAVVGSPLRADPGVHARRFGLCSILLRDWLVTAIDTSRTASAKGRVLSEMWLRSSRESRALSGVRSVRGNAACCITRHCTGPRPLDIYCSSNGRRRGRGQ
jgi:hypothetical protein